MAYIGRQPQYGAFEKQSLTADGSTTTFSLNYTVGSSSSLLVSVAGVQQEPEVGYNLSAGGTQIIFSESFTFLTLCSNVATTMDSLISSIFNICDMFFWKYHFFLQRWVQNIRAYFEIMHMSEDQPGPAEFSPADRSSA